MSKHVGKAQELPHDVYLWEGDMMKNVRKSRICMIPLCESVRLLGKQRVAYCLCVRQSQGKREFLITVELENERSEVNLGDRAEHAFEFYRRMSNGVVTPCVLGELFEDFCYEMNINEREISQNIFTFDAECVKI